MPHQRVRIIIIWLFSGLFLLACSKGGANTPDKYQPVKNPNPKYFLTITGKVLGKGNGNFRFIADYETTNDKCYKLINKFEGITEPRQRLINYDINLSNSPINIKIPLQYFHPGFCRWKLININLKINNTNGEATIFGLNKKESIKGINLVFKNDTKKGWLLTSPEYLPDIASTKNYHFTITIHPKESNQ